jgi:hypothetical protein
MTDGSHHLSDNSAALRGERSPQRNTTFLDESLVPWAPALCRQDAMKLLTDLSSCAWNSYGFLPSKAAALTLIAVPHPACEQSFRLPP